jgi:hypothetical protein
VLKGRLEHLALVAKVTTLVVSTLPHLVDLRLPISLG